MVWASTTIFRMALASMGVMVSGWSRWQIAYPLMALSLLLLVGTLFGLKVLWSDDSWLYRVLAVVSCLVLCGNVAVSASIGMKPTPALPWWRIGLVLPGIAFGAGVALLRTST